MNLSSVLVYWHTHTYSANYSYIYCITKFFLSLKKFYIIRYVITRQINANNWLKSFV